MQYMATFSGFLSSFGTSIPTDIISSVSAPVLLSWNGVTGNGNYWGRYFYLGNLLVQFSDTNTNGSPTQGTSGQATLSFPIPFSSEPYVVNISPYISNNTPSSVYSSTATSFTYNVSNNTGIISFIAIGPR